MKAQRGQAIIEMLVVSVVIFMLLWGLLWLQRWQQIKLQTQHHTALQAFRFSQSYELDQQHALSVLKPNYLTGLYSPVAHDEQSQADALGAMPTQHPLFSTAQQEGLLGATQRWRFSSTAQEQGWQDSPWSQRLLRFLPFMQLQSQTSIWVGAGHALSDTQAVTRLGASHSLWGYAQSPSRAAISGLQPLLMPVDMAWGRAQPSTEWLQPWQESVPAQHLKSN